MTLITGGIAFTTSGATTSPQKNNFASITSQNEFLIICSPNCATAHSTGFGFNITITKRTASLYLYAQGIAFNFSPGNGTGVAVFLIRSDSGIDPLGTNEPTLTACGPPSNFKKCYIQVEDVVIMQGQSVYVFTTNDLHPGVDDNGFTKFYYFIGLSNLTDQNAVSIGTGANTETMGAYEYL